MDSKDYIVFMEYLAMFPERSLFTVNMLVLLGATVVSLRDAVLLERLVADMSRVEDREKFSLALSRTRSEIGGQETA